MIVDLRDFSKKYFTKLFVHDGRIFKYHLKPLHDAHVDEEYYTHFMDHNFDPFTKETWSLIDEDAKLRMLNQLLKISGFGDLIGEKKR